jgi:hypothetical protein
MNRRTRDSLRKDFANLATGNAEVTIGGQTLNKMLKQLGYLLFSAFFFLHMRRRRQQMDSLLERLRIRLALLCRVRKLVSPIRTRA